MDISPQQKAVLDGIGLCAWEPRSAFTTMLISKGKKQMLFRVANADKEAFTKVLTRLQMWLAFDFEQKSQVPKAILLPSPTARHIFEQIKTILS